VFNHGSFLPPQGAFVRGVGGASPPVDLDTSVLGKREHPEDRNAQRCI